MTTMRVQFRFLAAVPVGNEVAIEWSEAPAFGGWIPTEPIVHDRTTGIAWRGDGHHPKRRPSKPLTTGRVQTCEVTTKRNGITTVLEVDEASDPYRG